MSLCRGERRIVGEGGSSSVRCCSSSSNAHASQRWQRLAGVGFSAAISRESCFESFWNIVSCWAAPTIRRDIYFVSNEAMTCTLFPKAGLHRHSTVPLVAVSSAQPTQDAVALLHLTLPALHIEWLSLQRPQSPVGQYDEAPASPMTGTEPTSAAHPSASAGDQLSVLLSGKTLTLPRASPTGWWRSFNGVLHEFSSRTGKLVWYSRLTAHTWLQHPVGALPANCVLPSECPLSQWFAWREKAAKTPPEEISDLFYLIDVEVPKEELAELTPAFPVLQLLDDRTSPYSLHSYLCIMCPNLAESVPDLRPRLYFSPGIIPGVVTTGLHLDGLGHMMSYNWSMKFSPDQDARNLVDIYPTEQQMGIEKYRQLREVAGAAMSLSGLDLPHSVRHESVSSLAWV